MKFLSPKTVSSIASAIFHFCVFIIILFYFNQKSDLVKKDYIEVGFGGIAETNSPGMPGYGGAQVYNPPSEKKRVTLEEKAKKKLIKNEESLNLSNKKKVETSSLQTNTSKADTITGNTSTSGIMGGFGSGNGGNGQNGSAPAKKGIIIDNDVYYVAVDQMPVPLGGMESINARVVCSPSANNMHGIVYVQAFIDEHGFVRNTSLIKGLGGPCDQAALRAVKETRFEAGKLKGIPVKVQMTIAVRIGNGN